MKTWVTQIRAVCPHTGCLLTWAGPNVPGNTIDEAEKYCQKNGLGYCKVEGQLSAEIPWDFADRPELWWDRDN